MSRQIGSVDHGRPYRVVWAHNNSIAGKPAGYDSAVAAASAALEVAS